MVDNWWGLLACLMSFCKNWFSNVKLALIDLKYVTLFQESCFLRWKAKSVLQLMTFCIFVLQHCFCLNILVKRQFLTKFERHNYHSQLINFCHQHFDESIWKGVWWIFFRVVPHSVLQLKFVDFFQLVKVKGPTWEMVKWMFSDSSGHLAIVMKVV